MSEAAVKAGEMIATQPGACGTHLEEAVRFRTVAFQGRREEPDGHRTSR